MKIINTGSVRIRIEGYGYVSPGKSIIVPDDMGKQLCAGGSDFREVRKPLTKMEISSIVAKQSLLEVKKPARKRPRRSTQKTRANKKIISDKGGKGK